MTGRDAGGGTGRGDDVSTTPGYHPHPDDGVPLTRQWLTSRPWLTRRASGPARYWLWHDAAGRLGMYLTDEFNDMGMGWWTYIGREFGDGTIWPPNTLTRGDLRRLIVALSS